MNEGEGVGVGVNFQQKIICDPNNRTRVFIVLLRISNFGEGPKV